MVYIDALWKTSPAKVIATAFELFVKLAGKQKQLLSLPCSLIDQSNSKTKFELDP